MPERLSQAERSRVMAAVKSRDTTPEIIVRRLIHQFGYRFRLHRRDLAGTPDIILPRLGKIINVHGCFWHLHACPHGQRGPVNNGEYWNRKRQGNANRDRRNIRKLRREGWRVLTIWECQTRDISKLSARIRDFLAQ